MNSIMLQSKDMVGTATASGLNLLTLARRLKKLARQSRKPAWAHVPNRAWRRHSALLTYLHEAHSGRR